MSARKFSASMEEELLEAATAAAREEGVTLSAWLADAARERLGVLGLRTLVAAWEGEQGPFTISELAEASRRLDQPVRPTRPRRRRRP